MRGVHLIRMGIALFLMSVSAQTFGQTPPAVEGFLGISAPPPAATHPPDWHLFRWLPCAEVLEVLAPGRPAKPSQANRGPKNLGRSGALWWDALIAFIERTPWIAIVGIVLIYLGLKVLGVSLSF